MGADEVYLVSDRKFAGADTLATSYVLSEVINIWEL
jgi:electron transfer flavoprotein beta subunit